MNHKDARTLLVSPHQDDIALSLGGTILSGFFMRPIVVLNIFTTSNFAPLLSGPRDVSNVSRVRALEEDAFAGALNLVHLDLGLKTAGLRWEMQQDVYPLLVASSLVRGWPPPRSKLMKSASRSFAKVPIELKAAFLQDVARFDRTYRAVRNALSEIFREFPNATVVSPLSLASQPDHVIVACACKDALSMSSDKIFYEDLPYAWRYREKELLMHVRSFGPKLSPHLVNIEPVLDEKIKNLDTYRSQLDKEEIWATIQYSRRISRKGVFERLWFSSKTNQ